ncbi:T9SS type A sorting domain-containing protein [Portibacter marinus]|uniref:T9SS type A sorting domain-containing protein n=1 Tax=Portibacter marinus TaxID=2898660 RepID=UPI001F39D1B4|nr:T9SS type A sorting domain-containing protein [Portibacter marinus]
MKIHTIVIFLFGILSGSWADAQSLSSEVISSEGNVSNTSTLSIEWTLGELMVNSVHTDNLILTEGFHQPLLEVIGISDLFPLALRNGNDLIKEVKVNAWPNPFHETVNIQVEMPYDQELLVQCFNAQGRRMAQQKQILSNNISEVSLDGYASGLYFLKVSDLAHRHLKTMIINKL